MICCIISLIIFVVLTISFLRSDANPLLAFYARFFPNQQRLRNKIVWVVGSSSGNATSYIDGVPMNLINLYLQMSERH